MALSQKELEKQLNEAGNKLLSPPSITELISSLDRVESLLSRVEQSPSESMRKALSPSMKALISNELLRHSDIDVKVSVASCISEITRITAPDAPYEDDEMKEVFQLVVSSFQNLDDRSSPSYIKRTSILEIVAKVRSCVVMLDLECDDLIAEMFQHFFRSIRSEHPENVFSSMETIMALVLEESEDVSIDLVSSILNVLKTENKDVLPVARQLAEKVVEKSVIKIKPCLEKAMESLHTTQDDYPKVVANILKEGSVATDTRDAEAASKNVADENDVANESTEKAVEVAMETMDDAPPSEEVGPTAVGSPKSLVSNGTIQKEIEDTSAGNDNAKETKNEPHGEEAEPGKTNEEAEPGKTIEEAEPGKTNEEAEPGKTNEESESGKTNEEAESGKTNEEAEPGKTKVENSGAEELKKSRTKKGKVSKQKGKKAKSSKRSSEPSKPPIIDEKEGVALPELHEKDDKEDGDAQNESPVVDSAEPAEKEKESEPPVPLSKTSDAPVDAPPSPSGSIADENSSKKVESGEKKDELMEDVPAGDLELKESDGKKSAEEGSVSEPKSHKRTGKKVPSATDKEDNTPSSVDASKKEDEKTSELDAKSAKQSGKKVQIGSQREDRKKRVQGKVTPAKDPAKSPSKDEGKKSVGSVKTVAEPAKDEGDVEKESPLNSKRKRSGEKKAPTSGEELVGSKVQVWWPDDKKYYTGVVAHFDSSTRKHKVTYDDGDVEVLNLAKEKWKLVHGSVSGQEHSSDGESPDAVTETPKAKKTKTSPAVGAKQGKTDASAKKGGASSSKSKATPKSRTKQKEENKSGGKSKEVTLQSLRNKSGENKAGKTKDSKTSYSTPKSAAKSKDNDAEPSKASTKSKQETPKTAPKSKAKTPKSGSKSSGNSKSKAAPSVKDDEEIESSPEPVKAPESSKRKSGSNSNKSSKKAKRSTKG